MEPLELIAAKLVLGYLRSQKCKTAHREFLKTSSSFRHLDHDKIKYMPTRFLGQTLEDIVTDYVEISRIIQGRLEVTNYYNEDHPKTLLSEQLLYLLNKDPLSRASTPIESSLHGSIADYLSPHHSDVEATPVHTLPGNTESEESFGSKLTPRRKTSSKHGRNSPIPSTSFQKEKTKSHVFDTEILAQNLMANTEFQEKIAQTINKVVERQYKERDPEELNRTIKSAVEEAEADPIFEELLQEIIGSTNVADPNKNSVPNSSQNTVQKEKRKSITSSNTDTFQSTLDKFGQDLVDSQKQTGDALNSTMKDAEHVQVGKEQFGACDNPYNNYMVANSNITTKTQCIQNPVYINTMTGLLIPTQNPTSSFVVLNKPNPIVTPTILTEQDIMKMPIILKDNNEIISSGTEVEKQETASKKTSKTILPKPTFEVAAEASTEIKDFFKNYLPVADEPPNTNNEAASTSENQDVAKNEENITSTTSLSLPKIDSKKTAGLKKVIYPKASRKSPRPMKRPIPTSRVKDTNKNNVEDQNSGMKVIDISESPEKINTPKQPEPVKKPTPKSGSHIRNLDFSTPPKLNARRKSGSPCSSKSTIVQKNVAAKTLFKKTEPEKTWDSDLRASLPSETISKRQLTSNGSKKTKKKVNKTQLNTTTEQEGILLEAAIKTPVKTDTLHNNKEDISQVNIDESLIKPNSLIKTILSPSKLSSNTSKNILEAKSVEGEGCSKFITPDMPKQNVSQPIKSNRNITPMLETPIKVHLPKTPGVSTPLDANESIMSTTTPFTKMLQANLDLTGIDINSIPTPNLPITPGFPPFTPNVDFVSPYSNRPTDYSTGSSYYLPSDNEQNKNLEAHLREMEKTSAQKEVAAPVTMNEHLQMFNKNVIGKKNLSLMKKNLESSNSSESSSEDEKTSSIDWCDKETNDTIIFKKKIETPKRTYSLRTRNTEKVVSPKKAVKKPKTPKKSVKVAKKEIKTVMKGKKIEMCLPETEQTKIESKVEDIKVVLSECKSKTDSEPSIKKVMPVSVLEDLEKKRLRMVNSLKPKPLPPKPKPKINGKFKIKPMSKILTSKTIKKSESPRKRKRAKDIQTVLNDLITSDDSDNNFSLVLSEDEQKIENENKLLKIDKNDKTASDVEAQTLIEGLKERGIHLMHNKSSKKKGVDGEDKETIINTSSSQLETVDREMFDMKICDTIEEIHIVYDETQIEKQPKSTTSEDTQIIEYIGQLYLESIGKEVEIHLKLTEFTSLIDIKPEKLDVTSKVKHTTTIINENTGKTIQKTTGSNKKIDKDKQLTSPKKSKQIPNSKISIPEELRKKEENFKKEQSELKNKDQLPVKESLNFQSKVITTEDHHSSKTTENKHKTSIETINEENSSERHQVAEILATLSDNQNQQKYEERKTVEEDTKKIKIIESVVISTEKCKNAQESYLSLNNQQEDVCTETKAIVTPSKNIDKINNRSIVDGDIDDDLMNFASTGKEKEEDCSMKSSSRKRRLSDEDLSSENSCKKILKGLDLDMFLNKIHYDTKYIPRK